MPEGRADEDYGTLCRPRGFPFLSGVPCGVGGDDDAATKLKEHADGTVTAHSVTPFCFEAIPAEVTRIDREGLQSLTAPVRFDLNEQLSAADDARALALAALERDGAVILAGAAPSELMAAASSGPHPLRDELSPSTFGAIAHPTVMSLCDAVIGGQAMQASGGLDPALVAPPSLFTEGEPILSLPWELEDLALAVGGTKDGPEMPGVSCGEKGYGGNAELVRMRQWKRPVATFDLSLANLHLSAAWVVSGEVEVTVAVGSHKDKGKASGRVAEFRASSLTDFTCKSGDCLVFLGDTAHAFSPLGTGCTVLRADYQAAFLSQRRNMYRDFPPKVALMLPEHVQRLIGYSMPGPVLNKLYCGRGSSEILTAYRSYGSRRIDWAGKAIASKMDTGSLRRSLRDITEGPAHALTLHGLRQEWVPQLPPPAAGPVTVSASAPHCLELLAAAMLRDGCVVLGDAVGTSTCERVMQDLEPYSRDVRGGAVGCVPSRSAASWEMATHPLILQLCEAVLGRQVLRMSPEQLDRALPAAAVTSEGEAARRFPWQMHVCLTIPKQAGSPRQELHRDGDLTLLDVAGLAGIDHAISCIWALDGDFTEERGSTRVAPGSHEWPKGDDIVGAASAAAVMKRGSVLIYTGRTVHGAGHNTTPSPRIALNVAYNSSALKQEENMHVSRPPDVFDSWPIVLQELVTGQGW